MGRWGAWRGEVGVNGFMGHLHDESHQCDGRLASRQRSESLDLAPPLLQVALEDLWGVGGVSDRGGGKVPGWGVGLRRRRGAR